MPAASASSPTSRAIARTPSSATRSTCSSTSSTAAPAGSDPDTGDGAGILVQMPDRFLRGRCPSPCPRPGAYGAGLVFLPRDADGAGAAARADRAHRRRGRPARARLARRCRPTSAPSAGTPPRWPRSSSRCSSAARAALDGPDADRALRARALRHPQADRAGRRRLRRCRPRPARAFYIVSLSARTLIYKGMLTASQLGADVPGPVRTRRSSRRWPWCTSASRPTPSRRGRWRIPIATSPTTARSTRCRATSTGCGPAKGCCGRACFGDDLRQGAAGDHARAAATPRRSTTCSSSW